MQKDIKEKIMNINKKIFLASTAVLSLAAAKTTVKADEHGELWTPRTVEQVQADLVSNGDTTTYTVQYGDTFGTIAEAMGIDVDFLAEVNNIEDIDLIHPGVTLTATYNRHNDTTVLEIQLTSEETIVAVQDAVNKTVEIVNEAPVLAPVVTETGIEVVAKEETVATPETATEEVAEIVETATESTPNIVTTLSTVNTSATEATATDTVVATTETTAVTENAELSTEVTEEPVSETAEETVTTSAEETTTAEEEVIDFATPIDNPTNVTEAAPQGQYEAPPVELLTITDVETPETVVEVQAEEEAPVAEEPVVTEAPVEETAPVEEVAVAETAKDYAAIAAANPQNANLQPQTAAFKEEVADIFGVTEFSLYRAGDSGDHGKGLAVDFMVEVGSDLGDEIAQYAIDNIASANISYIIWEQAFYSPYPTYYGPANTWNPMEDRGSITENHYDHVHVSFNG